VSGLDLATSTTPETAMNDAQINFHIAEYTALRAEANQRIDALMDVEREVVIGSFVLYAWLFGRNSIDLWTYLALWLPVMLSGISYFRLEANRRRIRQLGDYLRNLEFRLANPDLKGWEHLLEHIRQTGPDFPAKYYSRVGRLYVVCTVVFAIAVTIVLYLLKRQSYP
jgi:hypothetical protein